MRWERSELTANLRGKSFSYSFSFSVRQIRRKLLMSGITLRKIVVPQPSFYAHPWPHRTLGAGKLRSVTLGECIQLSQRATCLESFTKERHFIFPVRPLRWLVLPLRCLERPLQCLERPLQCLVRPFKCLVRPLQCLVRPFKCLVRPFKCLVRAFQCLVRAFKCLVRPLRCLVRALRCLIRAF